MAPSYATAPASSPTPVVVNHISPLQPHHHPSPNRPVSSCVRPCCPLPSSLLRRCAVVATHNARLFYLSRGLTTILPLSPYPPPSSDSKEQARELRVSSMLLSIVSLSRSSLFQMLCLDEPRLPQGAPVIPFVRVTTTSTPSPSCAPLLPPSATQALATPLPLPALPPMSRVALALALSFRLTR